MPTLKVYVLLWTALSLGLPFFEPGILFTLGCIIHGTLYVCAKRERTRKRNELARHDVRGFRRARTDLQRRYDEAAPLRRAHETSRRRKRGSTAPNASAPARSPVAPVPFRPPHKLREPVARGHTYKPVGRVARLVERPGISRPIRSLAELAAYQHGQPSSVPARVPLRRAPQSWWRHGRESSRPLVLVCHDMKGGYVEDDVDGPTAIEHGFVFRHWTCADIFVYFSHELLSIPPGAWIDASHRNDCPALATLIFEWEKGSVAVTELLAGPAGTNPPESSEPSYAFADLLVDVARDHCIDGFLVNVECTLPVSQVRRLGKWVAYLRDKLHRAIGGLVLWYDAVTTDGELAWQNALTEKNELFFDASDGIFLNYTWKESNIRASKDRAGTRARDVFAGIDVFGRGAPGGLETPDRARLPLAHGLSVAVFAPAWPWEHHDNRNPERIVQADACIWESGVAELLPCRSVSLPLFATFGDGRGIASFAFGVPARDSGGNGKASARLSDRSASKSSPSQRLTDGSRMAAISRALSSSDGEPDDGEGDGDGDSPQRFSAELVTITAYHDVRSISYLPRLGCPVSCGPRVDSAVEAETGSSRSREPPRPPTVFVTHAVAWSGGSALCVAFDRDDPAPAVLAALNHSLDTGRALRISVTVGCDANDEDVIDSLRLRLAVRDAGGEMGTHDIRLGSESAGSSLSWATSRRSRCLGHAIAPPHEETVQFILRDVALRGVEEEMFPVVDCETASWPADAPRPLWPAASFCRALARPVLRSAAVLQNSVLWRTVCMTVVCHELGGTLSSLSLCGPASSVVFIGELAVSALPVHSVPPASALSHTGSDAAVAATSSRDLAPETRSYPSEHREATERGDTRGSTGSPGRAGDRLAAIDGAVSGGETTAQEQQPRLLSRMRLRAAYHNLSHPLHEDLWSMIRGSGDTESDQRPAGAQKCGDGTERVCVWGSWSARGDVDRVDVFVLSAAGVRYLVDNRVKMSRVSAAWLSHGQGMEVYLRSSFVRTVWGADFVFDGLALQTCQQGLWYALLVVTSASASREFAVVPIDYVY